MPNCCENDLWVYGESQVVADFMEAIKTDESLLSFEKIVPMPPELLENDGWYKWCCEHWGTKWDACDVEVDPLDDDDIETTVEYHFNTAWTPPKPAVRAMAKRNRSSLRE
jgi:Ferredoxin-like domain in Api92-like protein